MTVAAKSGDYKTQVAPGNAVLLLVRVFAGTGGRLRLRRSVSRPMRPFRLRSRRLPRS
jgi:hypothetical protein